MKNLAAIQSAHRKSRRAETLESLVWSLLIVAGGMALTDSAKTAAPFGLLVIALLVLFSGLGWGLGRRSLAAVLLGTLPLGTSICSGLVGHACSAGGCVSLCAPFCAAGGFAAGLLLSRMALGSARSFSSWVSGASLVVATGAIGCACVGAAGITGMTAGLLLSSALWSLRSWLVA